MNRSLELPMNMFENVSPITLFNESLYIVSMIDISEHHRRRVLERLFFHDIINTSGALQGLVSILKDDVPEDIKPEMEFVEDAFKGLVEEIIEQKLISDAENNELTTEDITFQSQEIIQTVVKLYEKHEVAQNKSIKISDDSENIFFKSDYVLLKRVLSNMVKNALEATKISDCVEIGCRRISIEEKYIEFWVWNKEYIPKDIQSQIFKRFYSTKGKNRGMGTYSMKLFGEKYLSGKVGFETSEEFGTKFYLRLIN